jgi:accessory gene regulator protein AgrB
MNMKTTVLGYLVAIVTAIAAYLNANQDWNHMNWMSLGASVLMVVWGHVQADAKPPKPPLP